MQFSSAYYSLDMMLMIPRGAPYTPLEKLLRPFKFSVWMILAISFVVVFVAVFVIKRFPKRTQTLFFDRNINSPFMEMLVIIFGGSQHALPSTNFTRILLMTFAIYCFVFRAIYTGSLFKFLQSDGHKKDFETLDQLLDAGFTFYMDPGVEHMLLFTKFYHTPQSHPTNIYQTLHNNTLDPNYKGAVVSSNQEITHLNKMYHRHFAYTACNEPILGTPAVFYMQKNSYLTEVINEKIDELKSNGLISFWISQYLDPKYLHVKKEEGEPRKLSVSELMGTFQLFLFGILCATICFVSECLLTGNVFNNCRSRAFVPFRK